jgi:hypothetical protein
LWSIEPIPYGEWLDLGGKNIREQSKDVEKIKRGKVK